MSSAPLTVPLPNIPLAFFATAVSWTTGVVARQYKQDCLARVGELVSEYLAARRAACCGAPCAGWPLRTDTGRRCATVDF